MLSKTEILSPSSNYDRKHIFLSNMGLVVTSALHTYQLKDKMISINDLLWMKNSQKNYNLKNTWKGWDFCIE